ncbi:MAG: alpha-galactosidase, partial [Lachnospiraceae bacterium]
MSIYFDEQQQSFILQAKQSTYIISIIKEKYLSHLYWGSKIEHPNTSALYHTTERPCSHPNADADLLFSLDTMKAEYPSYGTGDMRMPAYQIQCPNGSRITEFLYDSYKIIDGIPPLNGLPYVYSTEAEKGQTLEIRLKDDVLQADLVLTYSVFDEYDVILRSSRFENNGNEPFTILRALSLGIDFEDNNYDVITLSGSWARERDIYRRPLTRGITAVESRRGASGHSDSPFLALVTPETTEHVGEVYGFSLVYSGNFYAGIECNQYLNPRVVMGINPFDFSWKCQPGDTFTTPEVVMTYSNAGLNGMSLNYHKLYRTHLARGKYQLAERPILINNWEATYFDFNEEKILAIAKEAQKMGIEMLVLDDGWFGKRDIDDCSLGDWYVDQKKLPQGLAHLVDGVNALGMKFGLWFEPEAISPDSDLYRAHPDWCLHVPDRKRTLARNQLILDYSRKDVCDAIVDMLSDVLSSANIEYVKWDMNRNMTEIGSALLDAEHQMETAHRYILGLYDVLERITRRFPDVLFESCAGGGGRLDAGMMYYMPQNWTSDDT